jgi:hypothetical protein
MTTSVSSEQVWLQKSVELATGNVTASGGPFGAVIVKDGRMITRELFTRPREEWGLPVEQISTGRDGAPFSAWLSRTDRVDC